MATHVSRAAARGLVLGCAVAVAAVGALSPARAEYANPDGVAVVIGNRLYEGDIPDVDFAHRDAEAFRHYVIDVLGFDPENIIDLRDATQAEMWSTFGSRATADRSELWSYLDPDGGSDVVVFYSGHGAPGLEDKRGYLLPVNADPDTAELNGYPIDVLYENLSNLAEARSVSVYLDACFSGGSGGGGMLIDSASPVYVGASLPERAGERLTVLTAATGEQLASWDRESGHGLFTHHLLDALYGKGDKDADGRVTAREAKAYLDRHMTRAARRTYKRRQSVSFTGNADAILAAAGGGGAFPARPELALAEAKPASSGAPAVGQQVALAAPATPAAAPAGTPREVEAGLGLHRQDRRIIQHALNALDFGVGAADGKFGPRTRGGIRGWQESKGYPATGYLTGAQVAALEPFGRAARARAVEEAESRERERLAAARDEAGRRHRAADEDAFSWAKTLGTLESYDEYLVSYPDGVHAAEARRQRDALRRAHLERRLAADDEAFARATAAGTAAGYEQYLRAFPGGLHAAEARGLRDALREAETQRRLAADDEAFVHAQAVDTAASYHEYLVAFPRGLHAAEARGLRDRRNAEAQQSAEAFKVFGGIVSGILRQR